MNNRSIGVLCLCALLIFGGLLSLFSLKFSGEEVVLAILAIIAGVLILIGR